MGRRLHTMIGELLRARKFVPTVLMVTGALLLIYVGVQYGEMQWEQKRLADQWEQEQQIRTSPDTVQAHVATDNGLIRLVIPKIELTSFVVEGTNHHSLLLGPGHMTETAAPGHVGNAVISAHRDTFFRHLHELEKGDQVYVERNGKRLVYEVTGKKIVDPDDVSVTRSTNDSQLTLITCYPTYYIGPAPKRLVVFTKLSGEQEAQLGTAEGTNADSTKFKTVGATSLH